MHDTQKTSTKLPRCLAPYYKPNYLNFKGRHRYLKFPQLWWLQLVYWLK